MTHADRIREAERAVVDAATRFVEDAPDVNTLDVTNAVDALLALRAATCPTCRGAARIMIAIDPEDYDPCPESCDAGKRREP